MKLYRLLLWVFFVSSFLLLIFSFFCLSNLERLMDKRYVPALGSITREQVDKLINDPLFKNGSAGELYAYTLDFENINFLKEAVRNDVPAYSFEIPPAAFGVSKSGNVVYSIDKGVHYREGVKRVKISVGLSGVFLCCGLMFMFLRALLKIAPQNEPTSQPMALAMPTHL